MILLYVLALLGGVCAAMFFHAPPRDYVKYLGAKDKDPEFRAHTELHGWYIIRTDHTGKTWEHVGPYDTKAEAKQHMVSL